MIKREPRRHFSNTMFSPYFRTEHYQENHAKEEQKIEALVLYTINKILFWRNKNVLR